MRWRTTGWVVAAIAFCGVWWIGQWLSGYLLVTWLQLHARVDVDVDTYARYWRARRLPALLPYNGSIISSGLVGFVVPLGLWLTGLRWIGRLPNGPQKSTTRFVTRAEMRESGMRQGGGPLVGMLRRVPLRHAEAGHMLICAPSDEAAAAILVTTLLDTPGAIVVLDRDARLWRSTSGYRERLGPVRLIRPFAPDRRSEGWNPLARLSGDAIRRRHEFDAIAAMLYDERRHGARPMHAVKEAFIALAAYVYDDAMAQRAVGFDAAAPTFARIAQLVVRVRLGGKTALRKMIDKPFVEAGTRDAMASLLRLTRAALDERIAALEPALAIFQDRNVQTATAGAAPSPEWDRRGPASIYIVVGEHLSLPQKRLSAILLWDLIRWVSARPPTPGGATVVLDGLERIGAIDQLATTMRRSVKAGPRFLLGVRQPSRWRDVYGFAEVASIMDDVTCRILHAPSCRSDENDYLDFAEFSKKGLQGWTIRYDASRATELRGDLNKLGAKRQIVIAENLPGPLMCDRPSPVADRRIAARLLPPVTVDTLDLGDPSMPSPTLRAIGTTAALAFATTATTACSQEPMSDQALGELAKKHRLTVDQERYLQKAVGKRDPDYKWGGYIEKLVPTKLGPNTFMFPMNLYDHQIGPDFQGSVGLKLRWPTLEPFPAGAAVDPAFAGAYLDEAISIRPMYVSKVPIQDVVRTSVSPPPWAPPDNPIYHLSMRVKGEAVDGLMPYYIDMAKLETYLRRRGAPTDEGNLTRLGDDWFISHSADGKPQTFISCTTSHVRGAGLVDGVLEKIPVGVNRGLCNQEFVMEEFQIAVNVTYLRAYMGDWKRIEAQVRSLFTSAFRDAPHGSVK